MGRYKYHLYSGEDKSESRCFEYTFANTKNIKIQVAPKSYSISVERTVEHSIDKILNDKLFRDAIKKVAKLQLIIFGELSKEDIYISINDETTKIHKKYLIDDTLAYNQLMYCLCGNKLRNKFKFYWSDSAVQSLLASKKSKSTRKDAALDALILAKSKFYEADRFIYLWMSINGLYGMAAQKSKESMGENDKKSKNRMNKEYEQIKFFAMINELPYLSPDKYLRNEIIMAIYKLTENIREEEIPEVVEAIKANDRSNIYVNGLNAIFIKNGIAEGKMHPYAALLLFTSYQLRCKYFHAENSLPLCSFKNEHPIPILRLLNELLEDYLDRDISNWFDEAAAEEKANKIEETVKQNKVNSNQSK